MPNPFRWLNLRAARPEHWPRLGVQAGAVVVEGQDGVSQARCVIGRGLCRFRRIVLPPTAGAQGRTVLRNLLVAWSPFDDSRYSIIWRGTHALVWAWSERRAAEALAQAGIADAAELWPEALVQAPMVGNGWRLAQGIDGVDGQCWREGVLAASRWWPQAPEPEEWARWCVSVDPGTEPVVVVAESPVWLPRPWADALGIDALLSTHSRVEQLGVAAAIVCLVGLSAGQARQAWDAYGAYEALAAERQRLASELAPITRVRDRALSDAAEVERLTRLMALPLPLEVMQHLAERLPEKGVLLKEFELNGFRLRIALDAGPELSRATLVKDLQAGGWFTEVNETRGGASAGSALGFEMTLQGARPPLSPAAPTAAGRGAGAAGDAKPRGPQGPEGGAPAYPMPVAPAGRT